MRTLLILLVASWVPYLAIVGNGFVYDDDGLISENPAVTGPGPAGAWSSPYWHDKPGTGLYRPWTTFGFWLQYRLFGADPRPFHLLSLLLHGAVTLLFFGTLRRLFPEHATVALWAALIAAVHPLRSEAVAWITGQAELWAAAGSLLAYLTALAFTGAPRRGWVLAISAFAFALALLSKENAAGLVALPVVHLILPRLPAPPPAREDSAKPAAARWRLVLAAWGAALTLVLILRVRFLGDLVGLGAVSISDNVLYHTPLPARVLAAAGFQLSFLARLFVPWSLAPDYSYPQLVPSTAWMAGGAILLSAGVGGVLWAWRRRDRAMLWGIGFLVAAGTLTSNILLPIGTVLAERLVYLPSLGAIWILALAAARLGMRPEQSCGTAPDGRVSPQVDGSVSPQPQGSASPQSQRSASPQPQRSATPQSQRSASPQSQQDANPRPQRPPAPPPPGRRAPRLRRGSAGSARGALVAVAAVWLVLLGVRTFLRSREWESNLTLFAAAAEASPRSARVQANHAQALFKADRLEESLAAARRATLLHPAYPAGLEVHAAAEAKSGNPSAAVALLLGPAKRGELRASGVLELANAFLGTGEGARAESTFRAVEPRLPPGDPRVAIGIASALAAQSRWSEAASAWENAVSRDPGNRRAHHNWAFALWQAGREDEAEAMYRRILRAEPDDPEAQNDAAWFLAVSGRGPGEAVTLARAAYAARPDANAADTLIEALLARDGCSAARAWVDSLERSGTVPGSIRSKLAERCP